MRSSARRQKQNQSAKSRVKTLEKKYDAAVKSGRKTDAEAAFGALASALDKGSKAGVLHTNTVRRKKSRLTARMKSLTA